jgi:hypothetical protein
MKIRGDEPIEVIAQRNSLCSYLYLKQTRISCFSFFLLQNQRTRGQNRFWGGRLVPVGWGRWQERVQNSEYSSKTVHTCMQM